jgi:menaquinone-9 beta-reductase
VAPTLDAEVIIVGGGPAGSSTAFSLASQGVEVLVVDRARFPRDKICAEYLSPQASRILSDMNVLDEVERTNPAHLSGMRVRSPNGQTADGEFTSTLGYKPFRDKGLAIRRIILDEIVLRGAQSAGARVLEGARVTDVVRDESGRISGVQTLGEEGEARTLHAKYVVGADGLRSVVGRRLGLVKTSNIWPKRIAFATHYRDVQGVTDMGEMQVDYDGYFGIVDVGNGLLNVAVVVPMSTARKIGDKTAYLEKWIADRPHLAERFKGATRVAPVRATGPFAAQSSSAWARGAALVGDAADFFDPFTGEGMYAALRGGEIVAPFVAEALRTDQKKEARILAGYDRARKKEFGGKWKLERIVGMAIAYPYFLNNAAKVLSERKEMADTLVGVAGDFIPASAVLNARFLYTLFLSRVFKA